MSRIEITIGLLSILGVVALTALVGFGEEDRMERDSRGWLSRKVEAGSVLFDQNCSNCHGPNASGGICPPLDETSGLHGGELGEGIAWRLEELGWDRSQGYEYIYSTIEGGRAVSTREQYQGNKADDPEAMAMPAWAQAYGGTLRPDQIEAIAQYLVAFGDAIPADATPKATEAPVPTERPTAEPPTAEPDTAEPETAESTTAGQGTLQPATAEPATAEPATAEPPTVAPTSETAAGEGGEAGAAGGATAAPPPTP
ncbi:MAG: c-type cytochrome [Anaerolineae bacterium]